MSHYASLSTRVYYSEVSPGKWIKRVKEFTKSSFCNELNKAKCAIHHASKDYKNRANKKTK